MSPEDQIAHLKVEVIPKLFANSSEIGRYGSDLSTSSSINELSNLMEGGSASALTKKISLILTKMADASPERIAKQPSRLDRWLGRSLERSVQFRAARATLEQLLSEAEGDAQGVRDSVQMLSRMISNHEAEVQQIATLIRAGREFLDENPEVGQPIKGMLEFDKPRERFARKLANLATLLASHELSINQMKLTKAQATDMLDRFQETVSVLVPIWRQHTMALISTKSMNQALVTEASRAHQALMSSLAKSLNDIRH